MDKFSALKALNNEIFRDYERAIIKSRGHTEEKLKIECESINREYFKKLGIDLMSLTSYEEGDFKEYSTKRPDALYSNIRIEYKAVGILDSPKKREEFTEKVKWEYVQKARNPDRAAGILFDGHWIIIIKKINKTLQWNITEQPFNEYSLFEMLLLLINVDKRKLTPESLNIDFSTQNQFGKKIILVLFKKLATTKNNRTIMLFNEWNRSFSSIYKHAFDNPKVKKDFANIMKNFDISETSYDKFLFVLQTYYAFIVKLIASEAASTVAHGLIGSYVSTLSNSENLKEDLTNIENGGVFKQSLKIENFVEGDFFAWYLEEWDNELERSLKEVILKLSDYNFATFVELPEETKDLLKRFYQFIVPKQLRHDLGEYYTPDWLAQHLIKKAGYDGDPNQKVLDPACGSGTFLVEFIKKIILNKSRNINKKQLRELITQNVVGFDINPVAVLTARTNYLLALSPILRDIGFETLNIPVFLTDSIILPQEKEALLGKKLYLIQTTKGDFWIPVEIVKKQLIDPLLNDIEHSLVDYSVEEFKNVIRKRYSFEEGSIDVIGETFAKIKELNEANQNKVWTKIIKNSFAPVFRIGQFDYVIGNPPWVNWEFLSDEYANLLKVLSSRLGIFAFTGKEARHGHAKDDLAAIFTYACSDYYLKDSGRLAFLIKPLFQNPAGKGFRQFKFKDEKNKVVPLSVQLAEDLTEIKPFEGAQNETAIIVLVKGQKTRYPVKFIKWEKKTSGEIPQTETLEKVYESTVHLKKMAEPSKKEDQNSGWFISTKKNAEQFDTLKQNFLGTFEYPIRQGLNFGISTVYWFDIIKRLGNKIRIKNGSEKGKKFEVDTTEATIERDLVYPLVKSRNIEKWKLKDYIYALVPQKKTTDDNEAELKTRYPDTWEYLKKYKIVLEQGRKSVWFKGKPFYKIYGLGKYSWAPFKVMWVRMGYKPKFVVINRTLDTFLGTKLILPGEVCAFVSERDKNGDFITEDEAHYICAVLNSKAILAALDTITQKGKSGLPKSIIDQIQLVKYNKSNELHKKLSELSKKAHLAARKNEYETVKKIENEIDATVLLLYSKKEKRTLENWFGE